MTQGHASWNPAKLILCISDSVRPYQPAKGATFLAGFARRSHNISPVPRQRRSSALSVTLDLAVGSQCPISKFPNDPSFASAPCSALQEISAPPLDDLGPGETGERYQPGLSPRGILWPPATSAPRQSVAGCAESVLPAAAIGPRLQGCPPHCDCAQNSSEFVSQSPVPRLAVAKTWDPGYGLGKSLATVGTHPNSIGVKKMSER